MAKAKIIFLIALSILFFKALTLLVNGWVPFWYDPGRDLLLALDNLRKISLIGPPSGIPNVFYLPYWTWLLSLPLAFTQNPRWIIFLTTTLPYFIFLPLIFTKLFKEKTIAFSLTILFFIYYSNRATQLWSPNLGPLLFLILVYFVSTKKHHFLNGFLAVLGIGFNMGFGIVIAAATSLYYLFRKKITYFLGFIFALIPFFLFESRHGFFQIKSLYQSLLGNSGVTLTGLSQIQILIQVAPILILFAITFFLHLKTKCHAELASASLANASGILKQVERSRNEFGMTTKQNLCFWYLFICFGGLNFVYFISKNPKWDYHFIGLEIFTLLLIGLIISRLRLGFLLGIVTAILFIKNLFVTQDFNQNLYLDKKEHVVKLIYQDAQNQPFTYFAQNPAIYTYDYDYLFKWLGKQKPDDKTVYLIIPKTTLAAQEDFLNFKTPPEKYSTVNSWSLSDGTGVIKLKRVL